MRYVLALLFVVFLMICALPRRWRAPLWTCVILGCTVPWFDLSLTAHWSAIGWIPLVSPPVRGVDIFVNLVLYFPLGLFFALGRTGRAILPSALGLGLGLSLLAETTQVFSRWRFPSGTDLVMNAVGALAGAMAALMLEQWQGGHAMSDPTRDWPREAK